MSDGRSPENGGVVGARDAGRRMNFTASFAEVVRRRRSCRTYEQRPLGKAVRRPLEDLLAASPDGPFGGRARFALIAAAAEERAELRGLGTYGFIDGAAGFIVGAIAGGRGDLEDYGCLMERAVLLATDLGLGTCWLGGTFSKSGFAKRIGLAEGEVMPAVAAVGYPVEGSFSRDWTRRMAGSNLRRPPGELFFDGAYSAPLSPGEAGVYASALEMVRWAPSASNRQPWRIVRSPTGWHFYLERTKGYGRGTLVFTVLRLADLQRVDMGIAMCHFELAAHAAGLSGVWAIEDPGIAAPGTRIEYTATWRPA